MEEMRLVFAESLPLNHGRLIITITNVLTEEAYVVNLCPVIYKQDRKKY